MKKLELVIDAGVVKNAAWLKLLTPLSGLYGVVTHARKSLYHSGKCPIYRAAVPVLLLQYHRWWQWQNAISSLL